MARSLKKGPYVDERLLEKIKNLKSGDGKVIKTWARSCTVVPEMVGFIFGVYNGRIFVNVTIKEEMIGHKLGEFSHTRTFHRHGGKMQKELEQVKKEKEVQASKASKEQK